MGQFFRELKRRNVFRVATAYAIVAWLVLQVGETLAPALRLPDWVSALLAFFLILGFPIALFFAWAFELTPEGLKKEGAVDHSRSIAPVTGRKLDYLIVAALIAALGYFAFDKYILDPSRDAQREQAWAAAAGTKVEQTAVAGSTGIDVQAIAVLPFVNMSDDAANEYFSDGISEEILNLLARIPQLRVASRSSAFAFKGEGIHIPDVAAKLNVGWVLEGSVRKTGQRVRITAQLIDARSDRHRWSETYDRTLDDIFAVQDEIAAAVANAMQLMLASPPPTAQVTTPEAYELYLQAAYFYSKRTTGDYAKAVEYLKQVIALDPEYSPAWSTLGGIHAIQASMGTLPWDKGNRLALEANEKALRLDPDNAIAHSGRAWLAMTYGRDYALSATHFRRALELRPNAVGIIANFASLANLLGRLERAIELNRQALKLNPALPVVYVNLSSMYVSLGRLDDAETAARMALEVNPDMYAAPGYLAIISILRGEPAKALEQTGAIKMENLKQVVPAIAHHDLGHIGKSNDVLKAFIRDHADRRAVNIAWIYSWQGEHDLAFEWLQRAVDEGQEIDTIKTDVLLQNLHADPRWEELLTGLGLADSQVASIEI